MDLNMKEEIEFYQKDEPRKFNLQNDLMDEFYYFLGYLTFRMNKFEKLLSYYLFLQENIKIADSLRDDIDFKRKFLEQSEKYNKRITKITLGQLIKQLKQFNSSKLNSLSEECKQKILK